ncbi:MAG: UvrD-helicase domain-containing protein [Candidatus Poribacteria bacterium]|nr:UvrD-helicase domain-containing protein [Candidatus Poribacteria bacterium]
MRFTPSQQDALNIQDHICVTAGAGSGKTAVLVERYLRILQSGNTAPQKIVAITFTEKAAAEMKRRVIEKLANNENTQIREKHLEQMYTAPISTIHTFCSRILREFPIQAGVPANFSILQGIDQKLLLQQAIKNTLRDIATNTDNKHYNELRHSLQRYGNRQELVELFSTMIEKRYMIAKLMKEVYSNDGEGQLPEVWQKVFREKLMSETETNEFIRCLRTVLQVAKGKNVTEVNVLTTKLETLPDKNPTAPDVQNLLKEIADLITTKSGSIAKTNFLKIGVDTTGIENEIESLESAADKIKSAPLLNTEGEETDDKFLLNTTHSLLALYTRIFDEYQNNKLSQGKLDFEDLQIKTRDLLHNNEEIHQKLLERHKYYMVDEFQDTNELQHELVMLFTNNLKDVNLFIVGDPKQSIYGFRDADVRIFDKAKRKIEENDGQNIILQENFRSLRDNVGFVNCFFERLMGDGTETEYEVPYEPLTNARTAEANGTIEIILGQKDNEAANEYALIAQHIKNMVANEERVWVQGEGRDAPPQPIKYGDIAILIRYRTHLPNIEHALLSAGIPYLTTEGVGFYQRQEIYDIWNYLNFLNDPKENSTSLVGILRGPAFGISDTELYEISQQQGKNFWEKAQNNQTPTDQLTNAIATLENHMDVAHRLPVNRLILTIVNDTGMIGTLGLGRQGPQRWANYQKLLDLSRNFDSDEKKQTLADFIEFLDILITEEPREGDAPIEESSTAVQIMTIHSAKGKQFPVVILPSLDRTGKYVTEPYIDELLGIGFSPLNPDDSYTKTEPEIINLMKDRANAKDEAEKKRLFYVGATRAEDRLILSGSLYKSGDDEKPRNKLKWLYDHLAISPDQDSINLSVKLNSYPENSENSQSFQLNIPILRQLNVTKNVDQVSDKTVSVGFPEHPFRSLKPSDFKASFTIPELTNYTSCPLRYYLENVLLIPPLNKKQRDWDKTEMDAIIRRILAKIKHPSHKEELDEIIDGTLENYPELTKKSITAELKEKIGIYINNFLNSELAATAFSATESYTNHQIHADINGHIISSRFDRLFKDQTGQWHIINFKIFETQNSVYCKPEMGLYTLLFHKSYPNEPNVDITFYFMEQNKFEQMCFNSADFREITEQLQKQITSLQQGIFSKNLEHCCSCPYTDSHGQCIVKEP